MPLIVNLCDAGNIIINGHGVVGIVDHAAELAAATHRPVYHIGPVSAVESLAHNFERPRYLL
mgnify:CR=1 FL=1